MCSVLAPRQITSEFVSTVWMCEVDSLCMQQYHQLQRAQSCQSELNQPHQQRWIWWRTAQTPHRQHSRIWMHPRSRPQVRPVLPSSTGSVIAADIEQPWECLAQHKCAPAAGSHCSSSTAWDSVLQHH